MLDLTAALNDIERVDLTLMPSGDELGVVISPEALASHLYQGTDAAGLARAVAHVTPEPLSTLAAVPPFAEAAACLPRAYVECADDRLVPLSHQTFMQRAWPCDPVIRLATDYSPHYSDPQALAGLLDDLARHWSPT